MKREEDVKTDIYSGDSLTIRIKGIDPSAQEVPYGTEVKGVYFDGYPQIVKEEGSKPLYEVKAEKDIMVKMRDGVHLAVDVYRPDIQGDEKFPALISYAFWGKEVQEMARWLTRQAYNPHTPFWDGCLEAGNINYVVTRGYVHVIPELRNIGKSEGIASNGNPQDVYDIVEWIIKQPWCDGNVGMMGACAFAGNQLHAAVEAHPNLKAINPFEILSLFVNDHFHGIYDCIHPNILAGRHGNDSSITANAPLPSMMLNLPKEELDRRLEEALDHPDIKYNSKWYGLLKYPVRDTRSFDSLLESFHPSPRPPFPMDKIKVPAYMSTPWACRIYIWDTFEVYEKIGSENKKMMLWPTAFPDRPFVQYADETVRWHDYWLKGIDTGIMDEPPIKMYVMGINKWRFEHEWPLARTKWTNFYLHSKGGLSQDKAEGGEPDNFTQPAPYEDPTVYCLRYSTGLLEKDMEVTGPIALYLEASIDQDDTNWMVDLVDVDPEGNRMLLSNGYLKAAHRAIDEDESKPYLPIHPRQEPVPVPPGEVIEYAISLMPVSNVFKKGHAIELIIRNQDDLLSKQGIWGVYMLPFMRKVTHNIYFGKSRLLLPLIPAE